jgi:phytoene dehydrogenase-like protein
MSEVWDVVVAGAGHNSLITAAYLAAAGHSVLVLDARPVPGGGAATEEPVGPGFRIDTCSTGHTLIRVNPLLARDELGLHADYGLEYVEPDPVAHVAFPDGEQLTMWLDLDRTCEEIARFSAHDAEAYRRLIADYDSIKGLFSAARFTPVGWGPSFEELLREHPRRNRWLRIRALSAWDVIRHEFEDRHVQSFMLWMSYQTLQPVDSPGSGMLAYSLIFGRQGRSWSIPVGGSGALTEALVRYLEDRGATVLCDRRVTRLLLEDGRCVGVETEDGESHLASQAVLSTIHVKHLVDMAPAEAWGEDFVYGVETYEIGTPCTAAYYVTREAPRFVMPGGEERSAVSAGLVGWPEDVIRSGRDAREGRPMRDPDWVLVATPTLVDPSRTPGGEHTVKFLVPQPWDPGGGPGEWERLKLEIAATMRSHLRAVAPNMTEDVFLEALIKSPVDIEAANAHMIHGAFHGGDRGIPWSGALRPVPGYADHRMPIPGLYQTGGTTHPGGSVTGVPGRNAAIVMLTDLGHDPQEVMRGARREGAGRH